MTRGNEAGAAGSLGLTRASEIAVVTDSTADFADASPSDLGITIVPLSVNWGRDVLRDGIDITTEEFYVRLRLDNDQPHTAAPPIGIFEDVYRNLLGVKKAVISVHLSSKLSGTFNVAEGGARDIGAARVRAFDSLSISVGLGWLAQHAAELAAADATLDEITAALSAMRERQRLYFAVETLEYLQRGGRIGRAQAFLGGLLDVKPVLECSEGEVHPLQRVRTRAASLRRLVELAASAGPVAKISVVHGDSLTEAEQIARELEDRLMIPHIPVLELGPVIGAHAGPGVIGVGLLLAD